LLWYNWHDDVAELGLERMLLIPTEGGGYEETADTEKDDEVGKKKVWCTTVQMPRPGHFTYKRDEKTYALLDTTALFRDGSLPAVSGRQTLINPDNIENHSRCEVADEYTPYGFEGQDDAVTCLRTIHEQDGIIKICDTCYGSFKRSKFPPFCLPRIDPGLPPSGLPP
jgi:hypothetical protein